MGSLFPSVKTRNLVSYGLTPQSCRTLLAFSSQNPRTFLLETMSQSRHVGGGRETRDSSPTWSLPDAARLPVRADMPTGASDTAFPASVRPTSIPERRRQERAQQRGGRALSLLVASVSSVFCSRCAFTVE